MSSDLFNARPRGNAGATALDGNLRQALVDSRQRYKDLVEISSDFAWEVGPDGTFVFVSPRGALGWRAEELLGCRPQEFFAPNHLPEEGGPSGGPFLTRAPLQNGEVWLRRADGAHACLEISARPMVGADGGWEGARGICRDVTEDRARDAALARAHSRVRLFGYIIRTIRDEVDPLGLLNAAVKAVSKALTAEYAAIYRVEEGGPTLSAETGAGTNEAMTAAILGTAIETAGPAAAELDGGSGLAHATRYGGAINGVLMLWRGAALGPWSDEERGLIASVAEHLGIAIEQISQHEKLQRLSRTDGLTGLLNRRSFVADLQRRHGRVRRGGASGALVYCDLDNFKQVNDTHGHERGDAAIRELARLLQGSTRGGDLVARLGGDEFALWLDATDGDGAATRAVELLDRAKVLRDFSGHDDAPLSVSLGIAVLTPGSAESLEALMARADQAMYASKKGGKGRITVAADGPAAPSAQGGGE